MIARATTKVFNLQKFGQAMQAIPGSASGVNSSTGLTLRLIVNELQDAKLDEQTAPEQEEPNTEPVADELVDPRARTSERRARCIA